MSAFLPQGDHELLHLLYFELPALLSMLELDLCCHAVSPFLSHELLQRSRLKMSRVDIQDSAHVEEFVSHGLSLRLLVFDVRAMHDFLDDVSPENKRFAL